VAATPKPKVYSLNGQDYAVFVTGTDEGGAGLATVKSNGVTHHNLLGHDWREFIDSFLTVSRRAEGVSRG
jgi:hypothetical protein